MNELKNTKQIEQWKNQADKLYEKQIKEVMKSINGGSTIKKREKAEAYLAATSRVESVAAQEKSKLTKFCKEFGLPNTSAKTGQWVSGTMNIASLNFGIIKDTFRINYIQGDIEPFWKKLLDFCYRNGIKNITVVDTYFGKDDIWKDKFGFKGKKGTERTISIADAKRFKPRS